MCQTLPQSVFFSGRLKPLVLVWIQRFYNKTLQNHSEKFTFAIHNSIKILQRDDYMKFARILSIIFVVLFAFAACGKVPTKTETPDSVTDAVEIVLADSGITADGVPAGNDNASAVYTANDIVYYESGKDFTYGEGTEKDAHSAEEAAAHTVVHITEAGTYSISGKLSKGQIAVDLGDGAKENPEAVVTLILDGAEISCSVAPAVIFYNVYECATGEATKDVDTSAAGANVIIADSTVNEVNGSYVEKIYKPESIVFNEDKTQVEDAKKLHKYDGAFYSKMSMNVSGEKENSGVLNITAENEGLDSEMHLTLNGGIVNIRSGNDGINTNEDGASVTTVNGGKLTIKVTGETGEGDGIDSNGWLVINGGTVDSYACSDSADAGIDSDMGIHINGGTVVASGSMLDRIEDGGQNYAVFNFMQKQTGGETIILKDKDGKAVVEATPENSYTTLIFSSPDLDAGTYTLWSDGKQLAGQNGGVLGRPEMPEGMTPPEMPEGQAHQFPGDAADKENFAPPEGGEMPFERIEPQEGFEPPEMPDGSRPEKPFGERPDMPYANNDAPQELSPDFIIKDGANMFGGISYLN